MHLIEDKYSAKEETLESLTQRKSTLMKATSGGLSASKDETSSYSNCNSSSFFFLKYFLAQASLVTGSNSAIFKSV